MVKGLGCDIVELERIERALARSDRFEYEVLSESEQLVYAKRMGYSKHRAAQYLAGRWAAKEALSKALGTGIRGDVRFKDISVLNDEIGAPYIEFSGELAKQVKEKNLKFHVSISDTSSLSMAVVVCEGI